jgi:hypothetical protein
MIDQPLAKNNKKPSVIFIETDKESQLLVLLTILRIMRERYHCKVYPSFKGAQYGNSLRWPEGLKIQFEDYHHAVSAEEDITLQSASAIDKFWQETNSMVVTSWDSLSEAASAAYYAASRNYPLLIVKSLDDTIVNLISRIVEKHQIKTVITFGSSLQILDQKIRTVKIITGSFNAASVLGLNEHYVVVSLGDDYVFPALFHAYFNNSRLLFTQNLRQIDQSIRENTKYLCVFSKPDTLDSDVIVFLQTFASYGQSSQLQRISYGVFTGFSTSTTLMHTCRTAIYKDWIQEGKQKMSHLIVAPVEEHRIGIGEPNTAILTGGSCTTETVRTWLARNDLASFHFMGHNYNEAICFWDGNICASQNRREMNYEVEQNTGIPSQCLYATPCNPAKKCLPIPKLVPSIAFFNTCNILRLANITVRRDLAFLLHYVSQGAVAVIGSVRFKQGSIAECVFADYLLARGFSVGEIARILNNYLVSRKIEAFSYVVLGDPELRIATPSIVSLTPKLNQDQSNDVDHTYTFESPEDFVIELDFQDSMLFKAAIEGQLFIKKTEGLDKSDVWMYCADLQSGILQVFIARNKCWKSRISITFTKVPPFADAEFNSVRDIVLRGGELEFVEVKDTKINSKLSQVKSILTSCENSIENQSINSYRTLIEKKDRLLKEIKETNLRILNFLKATKPHPKPFFGETYAHRVIPISTWVISSRCPYCSERLSVQVVKARTQPDIMRTKVDCFRCGTILDLPFRLKNPDNITDQVKIDGPSCFSVYDKKVVQEFVFTNMTNEQLRGFIGFDMPKFMPGHDFEIEDGTTEILLKPGEIVKLSTIIRPGKILPGNYVLNVWVVTNCLIFNALKYIYFVETNTPKILGS